MPLPAVLIQRSQAFLLITIAATLLLASGAVADPAGSSQNAFTDPASPAAREISNLFWITTWIAIGVSVLVYGLMAFALIRYRVKPGDEAAAPAEIVKGADHDADHPVHHGNNKLEATYTVITGLVFAALVVLSATTLFAIETPPEGDSMTVQVTGHQWFWEFHYPAQNVSERAPLAEMHVPVNKVVRLEITSTDVNHAVWIPDLGVKTDAIPGRINHFWFKAEREGKYLIQCAEYCGGAHSIMHGVVVVETQAAFDTWVSAKRVTAPPPPPVLIAGGTVNITLQDFRIVPEVPLNFEQGANVTLVIRNAGTQQHSFAMGAPYASVVAPVLNSSETATLQVVFEQPVANGTYWCPVGGHRDAGMNGTFNVTVTARIVDIYLLQTAGGHGSWSISPETLDLAPGDVVKFRVHNNGTVEHNLRLAPPYTINTDLIHPGESLITAEIHVGPAVAYWCDVPGHRQLGMEGTLQVEGSHPPPPSGGESSKVPGFDAAMVAPALAVALCLAVYARGRRR